MSFISISLALIFIVKVKVLREVHISLPYAQYFVHQKIKSDAGELLLSSTFKRAQRHKYGEN